MPIDLAYIYNLCSSIEDKKKFLFVVFPTRKPNLIGIDVLDYESESNMMSGGWFTLVEAEEFLMTYLEETQ